MITQLKDHNNEDSSDFEEVLENHRQIDSLKSLVLANNNFSNRGQRCDLLTTVIALHSKESRGLDERQYFVIDLVEVAGAGGMFGPLKGDSDRDKSNASKRGRKDAGETIKLLEAWGRLSRDQTFTYGLGRKINGSVIKCKLFYSLLEDLKFLSMVNPVNMPQIERRLRKSKMKKDNKPLGVKINGNIDQTMMKDEIRTDIQKTDMCTTSSNGLGYIYFPNLEFGLTKLECALSYASNNIKIFPLHTLNNRFCSCGDSSCEHQGKHPRPGVKWRMVASTDSQQIRDWWKRWPDSNIGLPIPQGHVVIDVDAEGLTAWRELLVQHETPDTLTALTGGDGLHLWYALLPGVSLGNGTGSLPPGIDVRGLGGYVVAPPSTHSLGTSYAWDDISKPIAKAPEWLLGTLGAKKPSVVPHLTLVPLEGRFWASGTPLIEGQRDKELFRIACALRGKCKMEFDEIDKALQTINILRCTPPLDPQHVTRKAKSASKYGLNT